MKSFSRNDFYPESLFVEQTKLQLFDLVRSCVPLILFCCVLVSIHAFLFINFAVVINYSPAVTSWSLFTKFNLCLLFNKVVDMKLLLYFTVAAFNFGSIESILRFCCESNSKGIALRCNRGNRQALVNLLAKFVEFSQRLPNALGICQGSRNLQKKLVEPSTLRKFAKIWESCYTRAQKTCQGFENLIKIH